MQTRIWKIAAGALILSLATLACGLNLSTGKIPTPDLLGTTVSQTLAALTAASSPGPIAASVSAASAIAPSATVAFAPLASSTPALTLTSVPTSSGPQNSLVTVSTLCWLGPGKAYEISSAIQKGTRVELIGRGDIFGWLIVRNPVYHDPCWIAANDLQIDPGVNVSAIPIFFTPPTPTPTP